MNHKLTFLLAVFFSFSIAANAQTGVSDLKSNHAEVLDKWLKTQTNWRLALEKDWDQERIVGFKSAENAVPFYVAKDFNRDRKEDFAVILLKDGKYRVAVFNAPFSSAKPAFDSALLEPGDVLYYNKYSKSLIVGPYESDAGFQLKPSGKTYKVAGF